MKRAFEISQELYPFESHWCVVDDIPVHYVDEGSGPAILFCHGNPTWSFLYRDIVRALRNDFRCIAIDYPGMGLSGKPRHFGRDDYGFTPEEHSQVLQRVVEELNLQALTIMVQDWGGPIGLGFAGRCPERIAKLVIGNTWGWPAQTLDVKIFSTALGQGLGSWLIMQRNVFVEHLLPAGVGRKERLTKEVMAAYRGPYRERSDRTPTAVFPRAIMSSRAFLSDVEAGLANLADLPVQLVWGDKDKVFKKRDLTRWRSIFPRARVEMLRGANHFIQEDAPEQIVRTIRQFMG